MASLSEVLVAGRGEVSVESGNETMRLECYRRQGAFPGSEKVLSAIFSALLNALSSGTIFH